MVDVNISRRDLVRSGAAAGAMGLARSALARVPPHHTQPNMVFILADDLGFADLSCYGRRDYRTPNIDRLAASGMRFTQAYANSAVCSATRTGLITGRYQNRLPIGLEEPLQNRDVGLPPSHPTLPSLLRKVGYTTTLIGKWHLGMLPKYGPLLSGYDHFWGLRGGGIDYFSHEVVGHGDLWDDDSPVKAPGYLTDLLGNRAVDEIGRQADAGRPFFISLHFTAPHWPWEGPGDAAESQRLSRRPGGIIHDYESGTLKTFAAMVTRMDMQIGRVLAELERTGVADNTIVIFTSDNGGERYSDTWPFSGKKTELLEGGLRIPAIVRWSGHVPAQSVNEQVMISMDWTPTLLAAAGTMPDPAFPTDGMDLGGSLLHGAAPRPRSLFWRYLNLSQEACRVGDWKYLKILDNTFLFNVVDDALERANLKDRHRDVYDRLVVDYRAWNAQMLPLDSLAGTDGFSGADMADHYGVKLRRNVETIN